MEKGEKERQEEFEDFVAAALKVDPKGLSGKHRHAAAREDSLSPDSESPES